ncbi:hypothetical protein T492DRAFT_1073117 [Pavlovales sp. CCMP2436]|nr:hypothetical protein T492DRAFT_1073117 [Pavlovales sp. CCMP2436]
MDAQRTYTAWLPAKTDADKAAARAHDSDAHSELKALSRLGGNETCADCTASRPGWAALPFGVFVCIDCAQLHRGLSRHISQVKAFNTGTYLWFEPELAVMRALGNHRSNAKFCAHGAPPKPSQDSPPSIKLAFVRDKYEGRRWYAEQPQPPAKTSAAEELGDDGLQHWTMTGAPDGRTPSARSGLFAAKRLSPAAPLPLLLDTPAAGVDLQLVTAPTVTFAACPLVEAADGTVLDAHSHKKAAVLAAFSANGCKPQPALDTNGYGASAGSPVAFFAFYGL